MRKCLVSYMLADPLELVQEVDALSPDSSPLALEVPRQEDEVDSLESWE